MGQTRLELRMESEISFCRTSLSPSDRTGETGNRRHRLCEKSREERERKKRRREKGRKGKKEEISSTQHHFCPTFLSLSLSPPTDSRGSGNVISSDTGSSSSREDGELEVNGREREREKDRVTRSQRDRGREREASVEGTHQPIKQEESSSRCCSCCSALISLPLFSFPSRLPLSCNKVSE